jgi:PAS domain S-box-containing protein
MGKEGGACHLRAVAWARGETMLIDTTILDALPDAFFLVQDGKIRWASRGACHMLDATADGLPGRPLRDVLAPGEDARLETLDQQRREGWDLPETCRIRFLRVSDGSPIEADVRAGTLPEGETPTVIYCARDVTESCRAEELVGKLADVGANPQAMLGSDAMLDAAEPIFRVLGWTAAFAEVVEGGSITRRVLSPEGHPVGAYARTLVGHVVPFDSTPILAEVVRTRRAVFLPNVPTLLEGAPKAAVPLGESMTRAQLTRSA